MKILVLNSGSSSLKCQLIDSETNELIAKGQVERIGVSPGPGKLELATGNNGTCETDVEVANHEQAMDKLFALLTSADKGAISGVEEISAVGHRVVHGGEKFSEPTLIDDEIIAEIDKMSALAPLHNPPNLEGIRACKRLMPDVDQVAVFDTAFHQTMPDYAYTYALPFKYYTDYGVRRYGFHGTSHKFVSKQAQDMLESFGYDRSKTKVVTLHLGNGCSMAALVGGKVVDTTMGMTPAEGLVMGTRSGDIDPAIILHLERELGMEAGEVDKLINKESGLLGVSGASSDMRDIERTTAEGNERSRLALDIFCYRIRKYIGSYAAAMGGIDAIVFTGGIGENCPNVRAKCCENIGFLGLELDLGKNAEARKEAVDISKEAGRAKILMVPTNEELMIAKETSEVVARKG